DADDVVQTAFVNALTHLSALEDPARFKPWFRTVLIRCAGKNEKAARRRGARATFDSERVERAVATDGSPEERARLTELYRWLARLDPIERNALIRRRIDRESWEDVAESLDISVATAKRRVATAMKRLSKFSGGRDVI
ncbi:MAG: sigma-70 family RNA polymerase sigma factor, partial [Myxococcota bacterium]